MSKLSDAIDEEQARLKAIMLDGHVKQNEDGTWSAITRPAQSVLDSYSNFSRAAVAFMVAVDLFEKEINNNKTGRIHE